MQLTRILFISFEIAPSLTFKHLLTRVFYQRCGNKLQLSLSLKKETVQTLVTSDQSHLPVYVLKYWNTLFTQIYQSIYKDMKSYVMNNMVFVQIEVVTLS